LFINGFIILINFNILINFILKINIIINNYLLYILILKPKIKIDKLKILFKS